MRARRLASRVVWTTRRFGFVAALALASALAGPVVAAPQPHLVDAAAIVPGLAVDLRYGGSDNFIGRPVPGYEAPRCLLTRRAADALARAQKALAADGFGLKVFDCHRPQKAVDGFVAWASDPADQTRKAEYYPEIDKRDLLHLGYIARRSGHTLGATVDLGLITLSGRGDVDMGSPFDFFGPRSHSDAPGLTEAARAHRARLRAAMEGAGFRPYAKEWRHFSLR